MKDKIILLIILTILPQKALSAGEALSISPTITYASFISQNVPENIGIIQSSPSGQSMLGQDDLVYLYLTNPHLVAEGRSFPIISITGPIAHPVTGKEVGYVVDPLGGLKVMDKKGNICLGKITYAEKEILVGSMIIPSLETPEIPIEISKNPKDLKGYIIGNENDSELISQDDIIYIDVGEKDGLRRGDLLEVYVPFPEEGREMGEILGTVVVIILKENSSTGLVLNSNKDIHTGDRIRTAR